MSQDLEVQALHNGVVVDDGTTVSGDEAERIDIIMSGTEAAIAIAITSCKQLIDGLGGMVKVDVPGTTQTQQSAQLTSDHADSTVLLMRTVAREALSKCAMNRESDPRLLAARAMLASFHAGLMAVNIKRDSCPGIRLGKLFVACCHVVLHAEKSDSAKHDALEKWRDGRKRILFGSLH